MPAVIDRAEDAYDCFEYGLSDSCRLKITFRGDAPVARQVEKRECGLWVPGHHVVKRRTLAFWRPARTVYRQNQVFRRERTRQEPRRLERSTGD